MRVNVTPSSVHCEHHTQGTLLVDGLNSAKKDDTISLLKVSV